MQEDQALTEIKAALDLMSAHRDMVRELVKPPGELHAQSTPEKWALLHPAVGIAGEVAELCHCTDRDNLIEEAGDLFFYIQDMRDKAGIGEFEAFDTVDPIDLWAGRLLDVAKKIAMYGQPLDEEKQVKIRDCVDAIENHIIVMLSEADSSYEEAIAHNLAKLKTGPNARYADGYSDEAAAARVDKGGCDE